MNFNPKIIKDVVFGDSASAKLMADILSQKYPFPSPGLRGLCFYGVYGSGKTTYAQTFCDELEIALTGNPIGMGIEVVDCDKTKRIDVLLKPIIQQSKFISLNSSQNHYFIIDEVDNLTDEGQRALKTLMNKDNCVFILTTNYLHKVDDGLKNRCKLINFNAGEIADYLARIKRVLSQHSMPIPNDSVLTNIVSNADGSWRQIMASVQYASNQIVCTHPPPFIGSPEGSAPDEAILRCNP